MEAASSSGSNAPLSSSLPSQVYQGPKDAATPGGGGEAHTPAEASPVADAKPAKSPSKGRWADEPVIPPPQVRPPAVVQPRRRVELALRGPRVALGQVGDGQKLPIAKQFLLFCYNFKCFSNWL